MSASDDRLYTIGELAAELDVTARAIRFYEQKGLLRPERRGQARAYSRRDRARMQLILRGKNLGFSLEEIGEYLELYDADPAQLTQTRHLLTKVDAAITDMQRKRSDIERALTELKEIRKMCQGHLKATGL